MSADAAERPDQAGGACWCCGKLHPEHQLLHLNDHVEVTVCLSCADYLGKRANARRDQLRPSLPGRARDVLRAGRQTVIRHGWQGHPVFGRPLRWLGRHLP